MPGLGSYLLRDRVAGLPVGDVKREGLRLVAFAVDLSGGFLGRLGVDVEHGKLRALAREPQRDRAADDGPRAGDGGMWFCRRFYMGNPLPVGSESIATMCRTPHHPAFIPFVLITAAASGVRR